jgi:hypothetical protein
MLGLENLKVTVKVSDLLNVLKKNRAIHKAVVEEARAGYMERAQVALKERLKALKQGNISSLTFRLSPPADYTDRYNTAIGMLEMAQEKELVLSAMDYRQYVEDKWDFTDTFYAVNSAYSATALKITDSKR